MNIGTVGIMISHNEYLKKAGSLSLSNGEKGIWEHDHMIYES